MLYRLMVMLICVLIAPMSFAEDVLLQALYKLPPNVISVKQVCPWKSASAQGTIRLMKVEEKGAHKLYVQWLRQGIAGGDAAGISTVAIKELNDNEYFRFELPDGKLLKGACSIDTIIENIIDERRFRMTLYLMGAGKYEYHISRFVNGEL